MEVRMKRNSLNIKSIIIGYFMLSTCLVAKAGNKQKLSFNYLEIAPHPCLLLGKGEELLVKESITKYSEFSKISNYINTVSDRLIEVPALIYKKEGKRLLAVSRKALTRIYYLSFSYRITGNEKYLNRAEKELNAVCRFNDWNPSHFLDVGEMCMAVAIGYDWLYDNLNESTRLSIRDAIKNKAFAPSYIDEYNWFLQRENNWNSVCNAGLVFGALAIMDTDSEVAVPIIERALKSNLLALKAYAPDGNYPEGPGYWNYGTSFQVMLIAALESALGSDNGLSGASGFMKSADYMLFASGPSGDYFNYYDCGPEQTPRSSMFWFAGKLNQPSLVFPECELINSGNYTQKVSSDIERILPNALVFGKCIDLTNIQDTNDLMFAGKGTTPVVIARTSWDNKHVKYLGIKGGSASNSHAHMDQGTFVYDIDNIRWAMDFGLQSYITLESKGIDLWDLDQDSQRWGVFRYNNLNHNTITINNQLHNVTGRAEIIEVYEKNELGAKIDLTAVLNRNNELKSAIRKATLVDKSYLKIEDIIETNSLPVKVRWNMVTPSKAEVVDKEIIKLSQKGKVLFLKVASSSPFTLKIRPAEIPGKYKCEFGSNFYGNYNQPNPGIVMVGFDATIPGNTKTTYTITLTEECTE